MAPFDSERFGFVRLVDFTMADGLVHYEYRDHEVVDGHVDVLRLNIYLCRDGSFVNIWNALIEPTMVEDRFQLPPPALELDFEVMYCERLFRGHIESDEEAAVILHAVGIAEAARSLPQVLRGAPSDLRCEAI